MKRPFEERVAEVVKAIPKGRTLSYARVALLANQPGAARAVVKALGRTKGLPWWRVIRSDGTIAAEVAEEQRRRLKREGVTVEGRRVPAEARAAVPQPAVPSTSIGDLAARSSSRYVPAHAGKPRQ
ncbi:MAG: MGMT family protein [Myxococcaceae bacterium]